MFERMLSQSANRTQRAAGYLPLGLRVGFLMLVLLSPLAQGSGEAGGEGTAPATAGVSVNASSIVFLTFEHNPDVAAARFELEAAEYQFKDFERNLSQFTPVLFRSNVERDVRHPEEDHYYKVQAGMEKEFFNGSSVFAGVGHWGEFGDNSDGRSDFLEMDVQFPLFGSNTTLRRITQRARQENEMFNARLEYVDEIREVIEDAQDRYFWCLVYREQSRLILESASEYRRLLTLPQIDSNQAARHQVEDEIQSLQSEILQYQEQVTSYLLALQFLIGLESLDAAQVGGLDLYAEEYYGQSYLVRPLEDLVEEARRNDIQIRVLENARENSQEKKELAERGQWDIFVDLNGQYDLQSEGDLEDQNGYWASAGFRVQKIDTTLLRYSLRRAEAEIKKYDALIRGRELETRNQIEREWANAHSRRQQCEELFASVESRRAVYRQKRAGFAEGREMIDNLIQSRRDLLETELDLVQSLGRFYESITELNYACGVYFEPLGIEIAPPGSF